MPDSLRVRQMPPLDLALDLALEIEVSLTEIW
jgi:hypothetical protein